MLGRMICAAMAFAALSSAASAATIHVNAATGNDTTGDGSIGNPFATIARGLTEAAALPGPDTIEIAAGTYAAQVLIDVADVTLNGTAGTIVTGGASGVSINGNTPVIAIRRQNVTVQNLQVNVNRPTFTAGIMAVSTDATINPNGAVIRNNLIRSFGSFGSNPTGIYYRNNNGANRPITVRGNTVAADNDASPTSIFTRGIWFFQGQGTIGGAAPADGNTILAVSQDLLSQFNSAGPMIVRNNTFLGAGIDFTEPNGGISVTVSDNNFVPVSNLFAHSLLLKHNNGNAAFTIENNNFSGHGIVGIWVGAWRNTVIRNNTFTPAAGDNDFTHIRIDSSVPGTNVYVGAFDMGATIQGNTFNPGTVNGGSAMRFYNDRKPNLDPTNAPHFTGFVIGGAGAFANTFESGATSFDNYIRIEGANTTTNYDENFSVIENLFRVAGGLKRPSAMTYAELGELHGRFFDPFDAGNGNAGYGRVRTGAIYLISGMSIARAEALSSAGHTIELGAGTYAGGVSTTKNLTVRGIPGWRNTTVLGTGTGSAFNVASGTALTLVDVTLDNFAIGVDMNPTGAGLAASYIRFANLGTGINGRIGSTINTTLSIFDATVAQAIEPQGAPASIAMRHNVFGTRNVYFAQAFYGAPFTLAADAFDGNFYRNQFFRDDDAVPGDGLVNSPVNITVSGSAQSVADNFALAQFDGDADGLIDAFEAPLGGAIRNFDRDGDGVPDGFEVAAGTNPNDNTSVPGGFSLTLDTDGDGYTNWYEAAFGTSGTSASSFPELGNVDPSSAGVQLGDAIRSLQIINGSITPFQGGANPHAINVTGAAQPVSLNNPLQILRFQNGSRTSLPAVPGIN